MKRGVIFLLVLTACARLSGTERLLFDDYYQHPRDDAQFGQGVARGDASLRSESNFYAPDATGIPNGTFVLAELIADKFTTEISREPISADLLKGVGAYLLVCPVRAEFGGRADLTEHEAEVLEAYVRAGGSLMLVANSITDPAKSGLDFAGLNLIGKRFGAQFVVSQTDTILVPIPQQHAVFDDVSSIIFGNGALIEIDPTGADNAPVLMTSHRDGVEWPVAVLIEHGQGKAILLGDAGTLGNAHAFRSDTGHAAGVRQMMLALLPDGPMPRYGWESNTAMAVSVREEQVISGYPEFMDVFRLPHPDGAQVFSSGMRQIDLEASVGGADAAESKEFVSVVAERTATAVLDVGAREEAGLATAWRIGGESMSSSIRFNGRQGPPELVRTGALVEWMSVLNHELIAAPLAVYAQPGDAWTATVVARRPQLQLSPVATYDSIEARLEFGGEAEHEGIPCYYFKQVSQQDGADWMVADLVDAAFAAQIQARELTVQAGGMLTVSEFWIHRETRVPVHTRIRSTASVWWQDPRFPDRYVGSHDSKNYENWETTNFVVTYGRVVEATFSVEE